MLNDCLETDIKFSKIPTGKGYITIGPGVQA